MSCAADESILHRNSLIDATLGDLADIRGEGHHPLRSIRGIVDEALEVLSGELAPLYASTGRPSIAPEKLLRALLLQAFYSVRSERQLMEQLDYNLLFRWFVGLALDAPVWDVTVFTKNRERLLAGAIAQKFLAAVLAQPRVRTLLSDDHFSVDGTLIEAWASMKSFRPKDGAMTAAAGRAAAAAMASATFTARSARTRPTPRPPIPTRGSTARDPARRPSCALSGMC